MDKTPESKSNDIKNWADRDRFVLSAGHGSAMLYSLLHLAGYQVTIDDLKQFRQWDSKTPGHPEVHHTDGVEATTGPLGQGIAMAVGMAMAEAHLAATYNKENFNVMDHYTYAICGDGDLMEGVSQEASSMAGHMKLGEIDRFIRFKRYFTRRSNFKAFTENVGARYEAYGWQHILVKDGNDLEAISKAIEEAKAETDKPTLIEVKQSSAMVLLKKEHLLFMVLLLVKMASRWLKKFMVGSIQISLFQKK